MRAGHRDHEVVGHGGRQRFGAVQNRQAGGLGGGEFGVVGADGRSRHDGLGVAEVRRVVANGKSVRRPRRGPP